MFAKLAFLTLALVLLAGTLLVLRQQRLELANQSAAIYADIQRSRQAIWSLQARSAPLLRPQELHKRIGQAQLALEPFDPNQGRTDPRKTFAGNLPTRRNP